MEECGIAVNSELCGFLLRITLFASDNFARLLSYLLFVDYDMVLFVVDCFFVSVSVDVWEYFLSFFDFSEAFLEAGKVSEVSSVASFALLVF